MVTWLWSALARVGAALAALSALGAWFLLKMRKARQEGAQARSEEIKDQDYEAAAEIRRAVRDGRDDRMHDLDDAGYRD